MKRIRPAVLFLLCAGCTRMVAPECPDGLQSYSIVASSELKSSFRYGADEIEWSRGDRMSVFDGALNNRFVTSERGATVSFSGTISPSAENLTAVYPYRPDASFDGSVIKTSILSRQWAVANSFSDGANLSAGRSSVSSGRVYLWNAGGYVSITIPEDLGGIVSVDLEAKGGETLSGPVEIRFDADGVPLCSSSTGAPSVTIVAAGDTLSPGKYYFVANPVTMASGFKVTLHRNDSQKASFLSDKSNSIRRNKVLDLGTVNSASLSWTEESSPAVKVVEYSFEKGAWPFDEAPGNENYPEFAKSFFPESGGYMVRVDGKNHFNGDLYLKTSYAVSPSVVLPGIPGYCLCAVRQYSTGACSPAFFTDIDDSEDYSAKLSDSSAEHHYRLSGPSAGEAVVMRSFSTVSINRLVLEYAPVASNPKSVISVGPVSDDGTSSFSFIGGTSADYEYGVEYIPLDSKVWDGATVLTGIKTSESGETAAFSVSLPSGDYKARAFARPKSLSGDSFYGPLFIPSDCRRSLHLDFTTSLPLIPSGSVESGSGTFDDPRKGIGFPTGSQQVTSQTTGETSNYGAGYWNGTKYVAYFPYTEYVFRDGGVDYKFVLGVPAGSSDRYLYWGTKNRLRTAYFIITYPVIDGFRLAKIAYSQSTRSSAPAVFMGIGLTASSLGETNTGGQPAYQYYYTPSALGSEAVFSSTCRHIFHIDSIDLLYIKSNE